MLETSSITLIGFFGDVMAYPLIDELGLEHSQIAQ